MTRRDPPRSFADALARMAALEVGDTRPLLTDPPAPKPEPPALHAPHLEGKMSALLELADQCEAATGPDREIDRDIALALGLYDRPEDMGCFHDPARAVVGGGGQQFAAPAYTASIDAALTLVTEGWLWEVAAYPDHAEALCRMAYEDGDEVRAATPALALCAAALRARAAAAA